MDKRLKYEALTANSEDGVQEGDPKEPSWPHKVLIRDAGELIFYLKFIWSFLFLLLRCVIPLLYLHGYQTCFFASTWLTASNRFAMSYSIILNLMVCYVN